jgi:hypothetical protein
MFTRRRQLIFTTSASILSILFTISSFIFNHYEWNHYINSIPFPIFLGFSLSIPFALTYIFGDEPKQKGEKE